MKTVWFSKNVRSCTVQDLERALSFADFIDHFKIEDNVNKFKYISNESVKDINIVINFKKNQNKVLVNSLQCTLFSLLSKKWFLELLNFCEKVSLISRKWDDLTFATFNYSKTPRIKLNKNYYICLFQKDVKTQFVSYEKKKICLQ